MVTEVYKDQISTFNEDDVSSVVVTEVYKDQISTFNEDDVSSVSPSSERVI